MPIKVNSWGVSDVGYVRSKNEDAWGEIQEKNFFVLADGMGGHRAGEVAAKEAVDAMLKIVEQALIDSLTEESNSSKHFEKILYDGIELVNSIVYSIASTDENLRGMGTTLSCLFIHPAGAVIGHAGDSRIYLLRNGKIQQITVDHTTTHPFLDKSILGEESGSTISYRNVITKAIGNSQLLNPQVCTLDIQPFDQYLICSDGLTDMVTDKEIKETMLDSSGVKECAEDLVALAKANGGFDNITVLVVQIEKINDEENLS